MTIKSVGLALICLLGLVGLYVFAKVTGGFLPWFLLYFLAFMMVYELATWVLTAKGLKIERKLSSRRLSAGQTIEVEVSVERRSIWPMFWAKIREDLPNRWVFQADGVERSIIPLWSKTFVYRYKVHQLPRGVYMLGKTELESGDLLGIVKVTKGEPHSDEVTVYPRIVPVRGWEGTQPEEHGQRQPTRRRADESTNVLGVRAYVPGDRLSRIHWPASARRGVLQAKEFELHVTSEFMFILDVSEKSYAGMNSDTFELAMSIVASLLKHAYDLRRQFGLTVHANRLISYAPGCGQALFMRAMDTLAEMNAISATPFPQSLTRIVQEVPRGSTLVVVSPLLNREMAVAASIARNRGQVEWFVPAPQQSLNPDEMNILQILQRERIHVHLIANPHQLATLQRGGVQHASIL